MPKFIVALFVAAVGLLALSLVDWQQVTGMVSTNEAPATSTITVQEDVTQADLGRTLFMIKGCATCHRHDGLGLAQTWAANTGAPDLTHYEPDPDFVRRWLRDPSAVRPGTLMPNLNLDEDEIEALITFLSSEEKP